MATGRDYGAGIGTGYAGPGSTVSCGDITISDQAQVKATMGDVAELSIGPALFWSSCDTVTINGEVWGYWTGGIFCVENERLYENPLYINWPSE